MLNRLLFAAARRRAEKLTADAAAYARTKRDWQPGIQAALNLRRDQAIAVMADFA